MKMRNVFEIKMAAFMSVTFRSGVKSDARFYLFFDLTPPKLGKIANGQ